MVALKPVGAGVGVVEADSTTLWLIPVPGRPTVVRVPFLPKVIFAPCGPTDVLTPVLPTLTVTPGRIFTRFLKFNAIVGSYGRAGDDAALLGLVAGAGDVVFCALWQWYPAFLLLWQPELFSFPPVAKLPADVSARKIAKALGKIHFISKAPWCGGG